MAVSGVCLLQEREDMFENGAVIQSLTNDDNDSWKY